MKKYYSILFLVLFLPSIAYASWWNPFTWFSKSASTSSYSVSQQTNVSVQRPATTTSIQVPLIGKKVSPKSSVPKALSPIVASTTPPITQQQNTNQQKPIVFLPPNTQAQTAAAQEQVRYEAQYQVVQARIQNLKLQYDTLESTVSSEQCSGARGAMGIQGATCLFAANQASDVVEYQNAIANNFITPVTDTSLAYEKKLDDLFEQVFQIKMDYHNGIANIDNSGTPISQANGIKQNLFVAASAKIAALNQQIQFTRTAYQNGIAP